MAVQVDTAAMSGGLSWPPRDLRGRAADGDGRVHRAGRYRANRSPLAWGDHQHLSMAPIAGYRVRVITLSMERLMDRAAERLQIDPLEIRAKNLWPPSLQEGHRDRLRRGVVPGSPSTGRRPRSTSPTSRPARVGAPRGRHIVVGLALFNERSGDGHAAFAMRSMEITPGYERVEIAMDPSGGVEARIGASPHGQGRSRRSAN